MQKFLAFFVFILIFSFITSCSSYKAGPTVTLNSQKLEQNYPFGRVISKYQGKSDYVVVLLPSLFYSFECQSETYKTLEMLLPKTRFVARQWKWFSPSRLIQSRHHSYFGFFYHRSKVKLKKLINVKKFLALKKELRIRFVNRLLKLNQFPQGDLINIPVKAPYLLEAVYQKEVATCGVSDEGSQRLATILAEKYRRGMITLKEYKDKVIKKRAKAIVENIQGVVEKGYKKSLVLFSVEYDYVPELKKIFKDNKVSYIVIQNRSCLPKRS